MRAGTSPLPKLSGPSIRGPDLLAGRRPARQLITDAGETLLPDSVGDDTASAEQIAGQFALNVAQYAWRARSAWAHNVARFKQVIDEDAFDLVIGDETYERWAPSPRTRP